jgi:hypothetical protein
MQRLVHTLPNDNIGGLKSRPFYTDGVLHGFHATAYAGIQVDGETRPVLQANYELKTGELMKKIILLSALLSFSAVVAQDADWSWARGGKGTYEAQARNVATDALGNSYITGRFGSPTYTLATTTLTNAGAINTGEYFLAKYDPSGNLLWARTAAGADDDEGMGISVDASGNVYVTGYFESPTIVFGTFTLTNNSNTNLADMFLVKYNSAGNVVWANSYGGANQEWGMTIQADAAGNTYVGGIFYSLGPMFGSYGVIHSGNGDAFVVKFNSSGTPQWAKQIGGSLNDNVIASAFDGSGNFVVAGEFKSSALGFSPNLINAGGYDIFYAVYDPAGNDVISRSYGGVNDDAAFAVTADASGNIFLGGYFMSPTIVFGTNTVTASSSHDLFAAKVNSSGSVQWVNHYAATIFSDVRGMASDMLGNIYMAGMFNTPTMTFGTTTFTNMGGHDAFLIKYNNTNGNVQWAKTINSGSHDLPFAITTDVMGSLFMTGAFGYSTAIGKDTLFAPASSSSDVFLAKMCMSPPTPTITPGVLVCAGAIGSLTANLPPGFTLNWFNTPSAGTLLATGNTFTTALSTIVYAALKDTLAGCGLLSSIMAPVNFSVLPSASLTVSSGSLLANLAGNATYSWYDCIYGSVVTGAHQMNFLPEVPGTYAVIITVGNCVDTSACFNFNPNGVDKRSVSLRTSIVPNPNNGDFTVNGSSGKVRIYNALGALVREAEIPEEQRSIPVNNLAPGLYFVQVKGSETIRVIVTK